MALAYSKILEPTLQHVMQKLGLYIGHMRVLTCGFRQWCVVIGISAVDHCSLILGSHNTTNDVLFDAILVIQLFHLKNTSKSHHSNNAPLKSSFHYSDFPETRAYVST